jgi:hypothetical protein
MITLTKEDVNNRIAQIDTRLQSLSRTMSNHPENTEGLQKLYDALMDERDKLIH